MSVPWRDDLRTALRTMRRSPVYTLVMVLSLALGLGAAIAAFSIVDAVRLRSLPFPDADRLVVVSEQPVGGPAEACEGVCDVAYTTFADVIRPATLRTLDARFAFTAGGKVYMAGGEPVGVMGGVLTPEAFGVLGATPVLGRPLLPVDDQLGVPLVTVLSHEFWVTHLAGDSTVIGRVIRLSDSQYTVVGVMPPGFDFESGSKFWLPAVPTLDPSTRPSIRSVNVVARLAPGRTLAEARAELATLPVPDRPGAGGAVRMTLGVRPLRDRYVTGTQSYDAIFAAMVGCLLALAVANLANLSLVRALDRGRETAVRVALGAPASRLVREQALYHALVLLLAVGAGLVLGRWLLDILAAVEVLNAPRPAGMAARVDWRAAGFAGVVALVVGTVLALAPIRVALTAGDNRVLRGSAGSTTRRHPGQRVLVMLQVAGAFVLLTGALLLRQSSARLATVDPGFDVARTVTASPSFPHPWRVPGTYRPRSERILAELEGMAGVEQAAMRTIAPLPGASVSVAGEAALAPALVPAAQVGVSPRYFEVLGIPVVRGRGFDARDVEGGDPVAVINRWAAQRWLAGRDPVGQVVRVDTAPGAGVMLTIVGVVADNRAAQPGLLYAEPGPELYRPWTQAATPFPTFLLSTRGDPAALLRPVRDLLVREVPDRPLSVARLQEGMDQQLRGVRTNAAQAGWMAVVGLLIAWLGIHAVMAYAVRRRTREIGIRGAMGATSARIATLLLREVVATTLAGIALGVPLALLAGRLIERLLFHTAMASPRPLAAVAGALVAAAMIASLLPTWRAVRIPAAGAFRSDEDG